MKKREPARTAKSALIWRISADAPQGKWVDPTMPRNKLPKDNLPEVSYGGWTSSTLDLLSGADVNDSPNSVPDALFDELFPPNRQDGSIQPDESPLPERGTSSR